MEVQGRFLLIFVYRGTRQLDDAIRHFRLSGDTGDSLHNLVRTVHPLHDFIVVRLILLLGFCISFEWAK